ncbi:S9 family peptidase [Zymomonas mobilis]|uniref:Oligopeptidase B n=1 Tax=Zymomonas mobilis subsp. pomaceae (strain ATCC 29192 / DSM 22645 / JCM 10191 / CCUG 17912 / NBRC 13757 / NCIMB 11200 / NRRL B-4491 / Barker I) TaxID=579138 RepID=F8ES54_ZYMMT|nr:S9 family peptidase [Zymomonas mobilis]AEI37629.1 Oligopeptidase B [Zymomonas mobilis subsp. pomaceae ATCC 29192]MDX5948997.1 S9 family peptidase [Zymomonas mobilis subsp. pomaceae]GEB88802.1 peptidase S9 [Zymomonas mobilis subsp. pomaceae]
MSRPSFNSEDSTIAAPVAKQHPYQFERYGQIIHDNYAWLKDPHYPTVDNPEILDYLKAENAFFEQQMAPHAPLTKSLFAEMKARLQEDEQAVPWQDGDYLYWWSFRPGGQYRAWYRQLRDQEGNDQLLIDEAAEAEGHEYFRMGTLAISPDGNLAAWSCDTNGAERFTLKIRDLESGQDIETITEVMNGRVVWSADSKALLYTEVNENWRSYRALRHIIGQDIATDREIYREQDDGFRISLSRSQDRQWVFLETGNHQTSEVYLIPADDIDATPDIVSPRKTGRLYSMDSGQDKFWILTNDEHVNFRLASASFEDPGNWQTEIAGSDQLYLTGLHAFSRHLLLSARKAGLDQIILRNTDGKLEFIAFPEASYSVGLDHNPSYDPVCYRLRYESMVTPPTIYDYDPDSRQLHTLKIQEVPSGYDADAYTSERLMLPARDGVLVPTTVVYRKDFKKDGQGKLLLYGYGAYGISIAPYFSTSRLSLLDRGFAYAIAHIRGGDDLGYQWYLDGKLEKRWNSFHDFTDVAKGLIAHKFTVAGNIAIHGGSAGGELMGVVSNTDPELWGTVVAEVPFVDVLNTMLDESLPLTPGEWPEWGNPITDEKAFSLILSYSPYDNVKAQAYPPMLITGGLNDPRVTYWEPAKWTARLRATKSDDNELLCKINMGAGHGGKSGRYARLEETAEAYSFILTHIKPSS